MLWTILLGNLHAEPASLRPDPRGYARPDRHFDIIALNMEVTLLPETSAVEGRATYQLNRLSPGAFVLDQVALNIETVTADDTEIDWWTAGDTLHIALPETTEESAVTVTWNATPQAGLYFRGFQRSSPDAYPEIWTQGQDNDHRYWMPLYDHPDDRFDFEISVNAPEDFAVLTNGGLQLPGYLIMLAAAPYDIHTHPEDSRFSVYVPPNTDPTAVSGVLDELPEMTAWFEEKTGVAYPWGAYRQVFVQRFLYGGMENTSATVQNMSLLQPSRVDDNAGKWTREVVAHELAHQWYGDLLTCRDWRERWLNEGFAEYMAGAWMGHVEGPSRMAERVDEWLRYSQGSSPLAGRFFHEDGTPDSGSVYSKGAMVLHMLAELLGPENFWQGMQLYTQSHQHSTVITADFQRSLETVSGMNLDWFFQQWVELAHIPTLNVRHSYEDGTLQVHIAQSGGPNYTLPVSVEIGHSDGSSETIDGWLVDDTVVLSHDMEHAPTYVAFNPSAGILADITQQQDAENWSKQLTSPSAYARRTAIAALAETSTSEPLADLLADSSADRLERQAAAWVLGEQRTEAPLVAALQDPNAGIRASAARALQSGVGDDATRALLQASRSDEDPYVRAEALAALARRRPTAAVGLARTMLQPKDITEHRLAANAAAIIAEHGTATDLRPLLRPSPGRLWGVYMNSAAALVNGMPEGKAQDRARSQAARAIEAALMEGDLRVRQNAIRALGQLADPDSIPHLEALRRRETVDSIARLAQRNIRKIKAGQAETPAVDNELEARLEDLEERLEAAEAELDVLRDRH